ncbi:bifunctional UDP-N-acetylglucosamine diphosphorylase/glucosamine-1-phosphate N-acetyltransferase GlmU [Acinetobacter sp. B5B]|uniref:bifunctional UDP-N-acetylglucosamine diphosphorylase/glucosamine-1-phosphate N-acetyltransferase GlmU n=1 Tax=Acinetobacter baretiae TaxID=2605383 RepID=UPI0018C32E9A|nr:bifunctional UDP-N-acetylglucosamine diphosphorylase/glucosamine-1-phosphate N-acetyltransferase GlmU [Acinetobacter baretiae]MBF7681883.1 bifunctional UDP-N-acetylglucosamine diphosphorylase/glucosamine-1-phosphate N-acetyltransferase GlmU [Acinetobacter baretiae]MBF7685743.1 bifunctional UDP-N-acetylglucosamine diphosphorylase/glucosamine-1-phosphate N-acetyltransferase GlmU [Acinetobacter baretiae]
MSTTVIILAAGKGTRMRSLLPKVLQPLAGKPLLGHVIETAKQLQAQDIITIFGHGGALVKDAFSQENMRWVEQTEQLGTGHAVQMVLPVLATSGTSLILYGDVPLVSAHTLQRLLKASEKTGIGMITLQVADPTGYGRIVRHHDQIQAIVEHKDASTEQQCIQEINTGIYCVSNQKLHEWLPRLSNQNAQGEYYLTDIIEMAVADGLNVASIQPEMAFEVEGVNDRVQLSKLEREYQSQQALSLMRDGVTFADPDRFDLRGSLKVGRDVRIDTNVIIEGDCELGDGVEIGTGCVLKHTKIAAYTKVQPYSIFDHAVVGENNMIGPFARLRPGSVLANQVHIGNFVEVKNSLLAQGVKANHFTYLGDAIVGQHTNIGAGTITCNYDGVNKHKTHIGESAFIGSNSALVAPIHIGDGATVAAGSVVTRDVANNALAIGRAMQVEKSDYQRPQKSK